MFAFVVLGLVFEYLAERLAGKNVSSKWPVLCRVGRKNFT